MSSRLNNPGTRHFNASGEPLTGGKLFFYEPGTTTPKTTYSDATLNTANANPVILLTGGLEPNIFLDGSYRVILQNAEGVQQWDRDNVNIGSGEALANWSASVTYDQDDVVYASDFNYYISLTSSNLGNDPTSSPAEWAQIEFLQVDEDQADLLEAIAALTPSDSNFIVGDGSTWVAESGSTVRDSLGLGTGDDVVFNALDNTVIGGNTPASATVTDLTATGAFTSRGIDDNATGERLQIENGLITLGPNDNSVWGLSRVTNSGAMRIGGGSSEASGGNITLFGGTHSTRAGDIQIRVGGDNAGYHDRSAGTWSWAGSTIIGSTSVTPDGTLHVYSGSAGSVTAVGGTVTAVFESSASTTVSILGPDSFAGAYRFGSPGNASFARMQASYDNLRLDVGTSVSGGETTLQSGDGVDNLTLSGGSGSELAEFAGDIRLGSGTFASLRGDQAIATGNTYWNVAPNRTSEKVESGTGTTASAIHIRFRNPNGIVGDITTEVSATNYNTSSDYRLKDNVRPVDDAINRLMLLNPVTFNFTAEEDIDVDGFLAHEAKSILPYAASGEKDAVDENGEPIYQQMDHSKLVPILTAALQDAVQRIEYLESNTAH